MFRIAPRVDFDVLHKFFGFYAFISLELDVFDRGFFLDMKSDDLSLRAVGRLYAHAFRFEIAHVVYRLHVSRQLLGDILVSGPGRDDAFDGLVFNSGIALHQNVCDEFPGGKGLPDVIG